MAKPPRLLIVFIAAMFLPAAALAQSDKDSDKDLEAYDKIKPIVAEMAAQFLDQNIAAIRTAGILKYCSKDGLAKAVEEKEIDRMFTKKLAQLIKTGRFAGLPAYSYLEAQAAANNFVVGYNMGFEAALKFVGDAQKQDLCAAATDAANKILAK